MRGARSKRYRSYRYKVRQHTEASKARMPARPAGSTLNHIIPVSRAFDMGLSPEEAGSIQNLEWVPFQENLQQGSRITTESIKVLRRLGRHDLADAREYKLEQIG